MSVPKNSGRLVAAGVLVAIIAAGIFYEAGKETAQATAQGDFGYTPNPTGVSDFLSELDKPLFRDAGDEAIREARGVDTFLYRSAAKAHMALYGRPWVCIRQGIGDCVSMGWAHGVWIAQSVDWETGRLANPPPMPATESIYGGSRVEARGKPGDGSKPVGGWSDGSYGAAAARWVRDWGVVYREQVGAHDLRVYDPDRAKSWGAYGNGGEGDDGKLDAIAKRHPAKHVALVRSFEEAAAALESGYPVPVCSMVGFASETDSHGFAEPRSTWAHCMCFVAVRYQRNGSPRDGLLCLNSWGAKWLTYKGKFPADQPDGSFWVDRKTVDRMLGGGDSFAVGSIDGFGFRELDNHNWLQPAPPPEPENRSRPPRIDSSPVFGLSL